MLVINVVYRVVSVTALGQVRVAGAAGKRGGHFREPSPTEEENYNFKRNKKSCSTTILKAVVKQKTNKKN